MKHKSAFLAGISLFCCFCLLIASDAVGTSATGGLLILSVLFLDSIAFGLPTLMLILPLQRTAPLKIPITNKRLRAQSVHLALRVGIAVAFASFVIDLTMVNLSGQDVSVINPVFCQSSDIGGYPLIWTLMIACIPTLMEEIFLRGAVLQVFTRYAGTGLSILLSALVFAMIHGSLNSFIGLFLGGIAFGWLTYIYNSIWPALIAHIANNLIYVMIFWVTNTYSAFGVWNYLPSVCILLLLLFIYLSFRSAERALFSGRIPHFEKGQPATSAMRTLFANPAAIAFILAFLAKTVFGVI